MRTRCSKVLCCFVGFSRSSRMRIWDDLPEDILDIILNEIVLLRDFIRFGAVCKTWYRVFSQRKRHRIKRYNNEVPLLFIPPEDTPPKHFSTSHILALPNQLFHILKKNCYDSKLPVVAPPLDSEYCSTKVLSASYGWLATIIIYEEHLMIYLQNPITGNTISLAPLLVSQDYDITLVVLSCNPSIYPDKCVVAYRSYKHIGCIRLCGKTWNICPKFPSRLVLPILFHKGKLYVLDYLLSLFVIDFIWERNDPDKCAFQSCKIVEQMSDFESEKRSCVDLVEPESGELLTVGRKGPPGPVDIVMCKLVMKKKKGHWVRIDRLGNGDEVLFLSDRGHNAMCSKSMNLQPNSIYVFNPYDGAGFINGVRRIVRLNKEMQPVEYIQLGGGWKNYVDWNVSEPFWIKQVLEVTRRIIHLNCWRYFCI